MKPIIVANWKANKRGSEALYWVEKTKESIRMETEVEIIVCPSYPLIPLLAETFKDTSVKIGAQDVSCFGFGAYTGEVAAQLLKDFVSHCIVGHSERRVNFGETDEIVGKKLEQLLAAGITPVLCVSDLNQLNTYWDSNEVFKREAQKIIFVYEPPGAISGGGVYRPESPETAQETARKIKEKFDADIRVLYGGSVNPDNIKTFLSQKDITGVLPGKASLDPEVFLSLVHNARP